MQSAPSVCPFVSTLTSESSDLSRRPFAYAWAMTTARLGLNVEVKGQNAVGATSNRAILVTDRISEGGNTIICPSICPFVFILSLEPTDC